MEKKSGGTNYIMHMHAPSRRIHIQGTFSVSKLFGFLAFLVCVPVQACVCVCVLYRAGRALAGFVGFRGISQLPPLVSGYSRMKSLTELSVMLIHTHIHTRCHIIHMYTSLII